MDPGLSEIFSAPILHVQLDTTDAPIIKQPEPACN
jgi:hypothetical protein